MRGGSQKGSKTEGTNHPNGVMTYFYLNDFDETAEVSLIYSEASGEVIKTFSTKNKKKDKQKPGIIVKAEKKAWYQNHNHKCCRIVT